MNLRGIAARTARVARLGWVRSRHAVARRPIVAHWAAHGIIGDNFGDKLNPYLIGRLSGRPVFRSDDLGAGAQAEVLFAIGSMLGSAGENATVWGTGFISTRQRASRPGQIAAVRGPLSRAKLLDAGVACPAVFGDPALLLPVVYRPKVGDRSGVGFIAHVRERDLPILAGISAVDGVRLIDVTSPIEAFADAVAGCRLVVSSSLHGIICAHAYGVPAVWVRLSSRLKGDGFKFRDYFASVGVPQDQPAVIESVADLERVVADATPLAGAVDLRPLVRACPFIEDDRKKEVAALLPAHLRGGAVG